MEVELPQSSEQTTLKPVSEVYIDSLEQMYVVIDRNDSVEANYKPQPVSEDRLAATLSLIHRNDSTRPVALYAHKTVEYGTVVKVLDMASRDGIKMVLATRPSSAAVATTETDSEQ